MDIKEKLFQQWILENWKEDFHNFSKRPNGDYWYYPMQDAWDVWQGAIETLSNHVS
jgi:hypothetical protein